MSAQLAGSLGEKVVRQFWVHTVTNHSHCDPERPEQAPCLLTVGASVGICCIPRDGSDGKRSLDSLILSPRSVMPLAD